MTTDNAPTINGETALLETLREVVGSTGAGIVFGEPISQNGTIVLPAAKVKGGLGGGTGRRPGTDGQAETGLGGGVGLIAKPLGVFVVKDGSVAWRPAVDVNMIILGGQIVALAALLTVR